jgi:hypothetical protein
MSGAMLSDCRLTELCITAAHESDHAVVRRHREFHLSAQMQNARGR